MRRADMRAFSFDPDNKVIHGSIVDPGLYSNLSHLKIGCGVNPEDPLSSSKNRIFLYAIAFIVPGTPKDLLCYMAALTDIDVKILLPIITLGRLPSIITSALAGAHLGNQKYVSAAIYVGIALTLSLCGLIAYRYIENKNRSTSV